jgi:hypothetical protein
MSPRDALHLALPASESMWSARSEGEWAALAEAGGFQADGLTLDMAMRSVFGFDNAAADGRPDAIMEVRIGPFARMVVVMTILRGLIEFGQGKSKGGFVTQCWVTNGLMAINGGSVDHNLVVSAYMGALAKVRSTRLTLSRLGLTYLIVARRLGPGPSLHTTYGTTSDLPLSFKRQFRLSSRRESQRSFPVLIQ